MQRKPELQRCARKRQRGISMIDMAIWSAVAIAVTIGAMRVQIENMRVDRAKQQGADLTDKGAAMANYVAQYQSEIMNNVPVAGVANVRTPTMAELSALGFLPTGGNNANYYGGSYTTRTALVPAACVPPSCNIESWVIMDTPVLDGNAAPSETLASYAAKAVGSGGGYSSSGAGTDAINITGMNGSWTTANPVGPVGAHTRGIVAAHNFTGMSSTSVYLRRDGTDAGMTGTLQLNNNDITNANEITSRRVSASEVVASGQYVLAAQDISTSGGNVIARVGNVEAKNGNLVAQNGWMVSRDAVVSGAALPTGVNPRMSQAIFYSHIIPSGGGVGKPVCPAGSTPQVFGTPVSKQTNPPKVIYGDYIAAVDYGTWWGVTQFLRTQAGWETADPAVSRIKVDVKCS